MTISYEIKDGKLYVEGEVFSEDNSNWTEQDFEDSKIADAAFNNLMNMINDIRSRQEFKK